MTLSLRNRSVPDAEIIGGGGEKTGIGNFKYTSRDTFKMSGTVVSVGGLGLR